MLPLSPSVKLSTSAGANSCCVMLPPVVTRTGKLAKLVNQNDVQQIKCYQEVSWHQMTYMNKCFLQWCQMEGQDLVPNEWTYNAKVKVHSSVGNFDAALDTVQQMQAKGVMPGRGTWDVIVSMAELMERPDIVHQVALHILHSRVASMYWQSIGLLFCTGCTCRPVCHISCPCSTALPFE